LYSVKVTGQAHLLPSELHDQERSIYSQLNAHLLKKLPDYGGTIIGVKDLKVLSKKGMMLADLPYVHFKYEVSFIVFKPLPGDVLIGKVSRVSNTDIKLQIFNYFPASIEFTQIRPDLFEEITDGVYVKFVVKKIDDRMILGEMKTQMCSIIPSSEIETEQKYRERIEALDIDENILGIVSDKGKKKKNKQTIADAPEETTETQEQPKKKTKKATEETVVSVEKETEDTKPAKPTRLTEKAKRLAKEAEREERKPKIKASTVNEEQREEEEDDDDTTSKKKKKRQRPSDVDDSSSAVVPPKKKSRV